MQEYKPFVGVQFVIENFVLGVDTRKLGNTFLAIDFIFIIKKKKLFYLFNI